MSEGGARLAQVSTPPPTAGGPPIDGAMPTGKIDEIDVSMRPHDETDVGQAILAKKSLAATREGRLDKEDVAELGSGPGTLEELDSAKADAKHIGGTTAPRPTGNTEVTQTVVRSLPLPVAALHFASCLANAAAALVSSHLGQLEAAWLAPQDAQACTNLHPV